MQFVMQPGMVYQYPLWGVALLLVGLAALGAMLFELAVHQFLSIELRRRHNDVAAAIFSVVGVTFAVLLAFVAMLAWEGFNKAKAAAYAEAAAVLDVYNAAIGLTGPQTSQMRDAVVGYLETLTAYLVSPAYRAIPALLLLVAVMYVRPRGLMGRR